MRTLAVLPVKTLSAAKERLAACLEPAPRAELAAAMLGDVLEALAGARELDGVVVVTAEPRAVAMAADAGFGVVADTRQAGQSMAAGLGIAHALAGGCDRVLLVPGDTPLVVSADIDELLTRSAAAGLAAAIVPDRHGTGTNALLLSPPDALAPSFGPGSLVRHLDGARAAGVPYSLERVPALEHDIDTSDDLAALTDRLEGDEPGVASRTRAALAHRLPTRV